MAVRDHLVATGISAGETTTEIINLARANANAGILWTDNGCTDFCWGISNLAGIPFFDLRDLTISEDPTAPQDVNYVVPSANDTNTAGDGWSTVLTTNSVATLTANMLPGDIVRIYGYGNTTESSLKINGHFLAHEFIVVSVSPGDIEVVDNWSTATFNTQDKIVQHSFSDISAAFAQNGLVNSAYVSRIDPTYVSQNFDQSSLKGHGFGDFSSLGTSTGGTGVADDFNHDGYSDILWRNNSTGDWGYTDVHNNNAWHGGSSSTAYTIAGVGDFNADGYSDVLWRNNSSGDWGYADRNGSWHGGTAGTVYSVAGVGDFNHDGYSDILWRNNSTGDWGFSDGQHNFAWNGLGNSSTAFKVAGVGDFNHDGYSDALWRNSSTGEWGYSDIHNGAWHGGGTAPTAFNVVGVGDFNGDGYSDVLWRNNSTGDWGFSDIHNNAWHGGSSNTGYSVAEVGDYNHDGNADIMWRNASTGDVGWLDVHNNAWHGVGSTSTSFIIPA